MPIESNLVIKTKVRKESKTGFESLLGDLQKIEDRLNRLSKEKFTVKLDLDFDPSKLNNLILNSLNSQSASSKQTAAGKQAGQTAGAAFNQAFQQATGGGSGGIPKTGTGGVPGGVGGNETIRKTFTPGESGILDLSKVEEISRNIVGLEERRVTVVSTLVEGELQVTRQIQEQTNLLTKATNEEQKRLRILKARQPVKEADIASNRQFAQTRNTELLASGFTEDTTKQVQATKVLLAGLGNEQQRVTGVTRTYTKELQNAEVHIVKINELTGAETQKIVKNTVELRKQTELQKQLNAAKERNQNQTKLNNEGFVFNREVGRSLEFVKLGTDGVKEATAKLNTETGKLSITTQSQLDVNKQLAKELNRVKSSTELLDEANRLLAAGYKELPKVTVFNHLTGQQEEIRKFFQVTSRSITGLAGELHTLNTAAGTSTKTMLNHAQVIRLVGDTWASAAAKVTLWLGATSLVFGTIRGIRALISTVQELEQNTVFLARVGRELGRDFSERIVAAKELTDQIVELAQATGGSATEAQQAAAVFLRAGQTQSEALESVRASLIASRIAEIDVADAAVLLSSAMQQFNINSSDLLPTLDSLNTLSNNYRVTTDDLLKSISRSGSIFSSHGGSLEELASITTVVAQRTSRTGAEIGNALKTIQSNLDRLDVREEIFQKLGIALTGVNGEALSFSDILLELDTRMDSLSESEQKELTILIGGVRQRNILTAAIAESTNQVLAFNKALTDTKNGRGSALEESIENSRTLEAAVSRLAATFQGLANAVSGPVGEVLSGFANLLTIMLQFINTFAGGIIPKVGASVIAFLALNRALVFVAEKVAQLGFSFTGLAASATTATTRIGALTASVSAFKTQAATAGTAAVSLAGGISKLSLASGVATAALIAFGLVASANAEAALTNQQLADERATSLEHEVSAERKKARAIENTTQAIGRQIIALIDLKRQGTGQQRLDEIQSGIRTQGQSVGIDLSSVNLQDSKGLKDAIKIANEAREDQAKKQTAVLQRQFAEQKKAMNDLENERKRIILERKASATSVDDGNIDKNARSQLSFQDQLGLAAGQVTRKVGSDFNSLFGGSDLVKSRAQELDTSIIKITEKLKDLEGQNVSTTDELKKLGEELGINADDMLLLREAQVGLISTTAKANELLEKQYKLEKSLETTLKAPTGEQSKKFLSETLDMIAKIDKYLESIQDREGFDAVFNLYSDQLKAFTELAQEEFQKIEEAAAGTKIQFFVGALERDAKFTDSVAKIKQELDRTLAEASPLSAGIAGTGLEESIIKNRVLDLESKQSQIARGAGPSGEEKAAAMNIQLQKDLDRLAELQLDKALSLFEVEKNIAIERKKSADEAARALGSLGEEDKLRVRAQAAFFAANPGVKIGFEQQFGASGETNRVAQQFFGGRLEKFDNTKKDQSLEGLLNRAGFGVTPEILQAEQEATQARAGRSDKQVIDDALNAANQMAELSSTLGDALDAARGLAAIANKDDKFRSTNRLVDQNGNLNNLNVNVQNNLNLEPLVKSFESATSIIMDKKIEDLANKIEQYIKTQSRPRRPSVAPTPDISE